MRKRHCDCSKQILHSNLISQLQSILSKVKYLGKMTNGHHTCFSRWNHPIVRSCGTVLVNKLHMLDISFLCCSFTVTRLSLCKSGERRESSKHIFSAREISGFCQQSCVVLCKKIRANNDHTAHRPMVERFDFIEPHVALLCVPRFEWVILRQDCLAHRAPFRSKSDRSVTRIELQIKRHLVRTRTRRSRSNVRTNISSLAFSLRFFEQQIQ